VARAVGGAGPRRLGGEVEHALAYGLTVPVGPALVMLTVGPHRHGTILALSAEPVGGVLEQEPANAQTALERVARHFLTATNTEEGDLLMGDDAQRALRSVADRR